MKRLAAISVVLLALAAFGCTDEPKPHLPDFDPDVKVDPAGGLPPGSIPGGGGGGTADAGSRDVSQDPDDIPDPPDAGDQ